MDYFELNGTGRCKALLVDYANPNRDINKSNLSGLKHCLIQIVQANTQDSDQLSLVLKRLFYVIRKVSHESALIITLTIVTLIE